MVFDIRTYNKAVMLASKEQRQQYSESSFRQVVTFMPQKDSLFIMKLQSYDVIKRLFLLSVISVTAMPVFFLPIAAIAAPIRKKQDIDKVYGYFDIPFMSFGTNQDVELWLGKPKDTKHNPDSTLIRTYETKDGHVSVTFTDGVANKFVVTLPFANEYKKLTGWEVKDSSSPRSAFTSEFASAVLARLKINARNLEQETFFFEDGTYKWHGEYNDAVFENVSVALRESDLIITANVSAKMQPVKKQPLEEDYFSAELRDAIHRGKLDTVREIVDAYPPVLKATTSKFAFSPLAYAARAGQIEIVKYLLSKGALLDNRDKYFLSGCVASPEVLQLLLSMGAKNSEGRAGLSAALHPAAMSNYVESARILIQNGADVNTKDKYGNAPLHYAASNGNKEIAKLLVAKGAKPKLLNQYGMTPFQFASAAYGVAPHAEFMMDLGGGIDARTIPVTKAERALLGTWACSFDKGHKVSELTFMPGGILVMIDFNLVGAGKYTPYRTYIRTWSVSKGCLVVNFGVTSSATANTYTVTGKKLSIVLPGRQLVVLSKSASKAPLLVNGRRFGLTNLIR